MAERTVPQGSAAGQLSATDGKKILKGAGIAVAGALLGYLAQQLPVLDQVGMGWLAPTGGVLINAVLKMLQDTRV